MSETGSVTIKSIEETLRAIGLTKDSQIMLHSSLRNLGLIQGIPIRTYPERLVDLILDIIGPQGTLCVPAPNWNYGKLKEPFDLIRSPVSKELGVISAHLLTRKDARRSPNPIFSVAAVGHNAEEVCDGVTGTAFGEGSSWEKMFKLGFENVFLGCGIDFLSFARYIEFRFGVPYLYNKMFVTPILRDGQEIDLQVTAPLRYAHCPAEYELSKFQNILDDEKVYSEAVIGETTASRVSMADCYRVGIACLKKDIHFFLRDKPTYELTKEPMI